MYPIGKMHCKQGCLHSCNWGKCFASMSAFSCVMCQVVGLVELCPSISNKFVLPMRPKHMPSVFCRHCLRQHYRDSGGIRRACGARCRYVFQRKFSLRCAAGMCGVDHRRHPMRPHPPTTIRIYSRARIAHADICARARVRVGRGCSRPWVLAYSACASTTCVL